MNSVDISLIKNKLFGNFKNLSLIDALRKINVNDIEIDIKSKDIKYKLKSNKKEEVREETIIIFGNLARLKLMNNDKFVEYFIDTTFKIIPKKFYPYKLLSISSIDYKNNKVILIGFVCFKYQDAKSYLNIFKYLNEVYNLNPHIIHSDFEKSIGIALSESKFFKNTVIHVKCFFHFTYAINNKIKKLKLYSRKNQKELYEIKNNIYLLCFIDKKYLEDFKKIILGKLSSLKK